jgi:hypothetical protein
MEKLQVWKKIKQKDMPDGRRCVKHEWVFKIKRNGVFHARLVACGYSQVPGVDFKEMFLLVVNDITVQIMLVILMLWKFESVLIDDVEMAFLHGTLKGGEEIYMDCPDGMESLSNKCLMLGKMIYGLVQSTRAYFKKCTVVLKEIGFEQSGANPCLLVRKDELRVVYLAMWVNDCLCIGWWCFTQVLQVVRNQTSQPKIQNMSVQKQT